MGYSVVRKKGLGLGSGICTAETCPEPVPGKECGSRGLEGRDDDTSRNGARVQRTFSNERGGLARDSYQVMRLLCVCVSQVRML